MTATLDPEVASPAPAAPALAAPPATATPAPITLDDTRWQKVLDATGGWAAACYQCGMCSGVCPWGQVRAADEPPVSVRHMVRAAQLGLGFDSLPAGAPLWLCTTCRLCEVRCPRGVPVTDVVLGLRQLAWEEPWLDQQVPPALSGVLWDLHWDGNPWGQPPSKRTVWARDLDLPAFDPAVHEALYYVGCTASYDRRSQQVARALVNVLRAAGVSFGTLGDEEPCCGDAAHSFGHRAYFEDLVETNTKLFRDRANQPLPLGEAARSAGEGSLAEMGPHPPPDDAGNPALPEGEGTRPLPLITTSPHCYDAFKNHYPGLEGIFRPVHYTQFLAELVESGRLAFERPAAQRVTFHDPCVLGRGNDEYEAPRRVLAAIPGVELVEMADNRQDALCCGGGGGRMWLETPAEERIGNLRIEQAHATEAGVLATACPYCISCLEDALKVEAGQQGKSAPDMRVLDVAEIAWQALKPAS